VRLGVGDQALRDRPCRLVPVGVGPLRGLAPPLSVLERPLGGGLGEPARDEVVAEVAGGDVDGVARGAEVLHVLEQDGLRHGPEG
jgi:hypothetical protein